VAVVLHPKPSRDSVIDVITQGSTHGQRGSARRGCGERRASTRQRLRWKIFVAGRAVPFNWDRGPQLEKMALAEG
jgi:hypothetical protein